MAGPSDGGAGVGVAVFGVRDKPDPRDVERLRREMRLRVEQLDAGDDDICDDQGNPIDRDGRRDYKRVYGSAWRRHYDDDRVAARMHASVRADGPEDPAFPESASTEAQKEIVARLRAEGASEDARLAAFLAADPTLKRPAPAAPVERIARRCPACGADNSPRNQTCIVCGCRL